MAEIQILEDDCEGEGERGKRGHRGHRGERGERGPRGHHGHRGHDGATGVTGATGPAGPASLGGGGLLKFSGAAGVDPQGGMFTSTLADGGDEAESGELLYPVAIERSLRNLATNVRAGFSVPPGGTITINLIKNLATVPVVLATIIYTGAVPTGIQVVVFGPVPFAIGDTFDLVVVTFALGAIDEVAISATVGVE